MFCKDQYCPREIRRHQAVQMCQKTKTKYFNSPRNEPLIVLEYWPKNIEEKFNLRNPDNNNIYERSTTQDVKNVINSMLNHVNSMEQGIIVTQEKFIESDNKRLNK